MTTSTSERPRPSIFAEVVGNTVGAILVGTIEDHTNQK